MAWTKEERDRMREHVKGLDAEQRKDLADMLELKPDASIADILKTVETLTAEVAELKKAGKNPPAPAKSRSIFDFFSGS